MTGIDINDVKPGLLGQPCRSPVPLAKTGNVTLIHSPRVHRIWTLNRCIDW